MFAKVIVAESEPRELKRLVGHLTRLGHQVVDGVTSGEEAIASVVENSPDLIVMGIGLQGFLDGIQAAHQLKVHCRTSVIYLTPTVPQTLMARTQTTDPLGYLITPVRVEELKSVLEIAWWRSQENRRLEEALAFQKHASTRFLHAIITLSQQKKEAEDSKKELQEFLMKTLEDCSAPLELLMRGCEAVSNSPEKIREWTDFLKQKSSVLYDKITNFSDLMALETAQAPLKKERVDLSYLVQKAFSFLISAAEQRKIRVFLDLTHQDVFASPEQLTQAIYHLIHHSIHSTPVGQSIRIQVALSTKVEFRMVDSGHLLDTKNSNQNKWLDAADGFELPSEIGILLAQQILKAHQSKLKIRPSTTGGRILSFLIS